MRTQIEEQLNYIGNQLRIIAGKSDKGLESYQRMAMLSALGKLNEYVSTGDSFDVEWYDGSIYTSENKASFPMVIGDLNHEVEYEDGSKGKATGLEAQYACASSIQFDEKEAVIGGIDSLDPVGRFRTLYFCNLQKLGQCITFRFNEQILLTLVFMDPGKQTHNFRREQLFIVFHIVVFAHGKSPHSILILLYHQL